MYGVASALGVAGWNFLPCGFWKPRLLTCHDLSFCLLTCPATCLLYPNTATSTLLSHTHTLTARQFPAHSGGNMPHGRAPTGDIAL